jgi:hypothetical protein
MFVWMLKIFAKINIILFLLIRLIRNNIYRVPPTFKLTMSLVNVYDIFFVDLISIKNYAKFSG